MEIYLILLNGKKDLENGEINFIGDADNKNKRGLPIRVLRYVRFFLNYSKHQVTIQRSH